MSATSSTVIRISPRSHGRLSWLCTDLRAAFGMFFGRGDLRVVVVDDVRLDDLTLVRD